MLIDAHVHLDRYGDLLEAALEEIRDRNIFTVATAMDGPSYLELKRIAARCPLVLPTFGIHPRRAAPYAARLAELGPLIDDSPAIGEIGLDFHWEKDTSTFPAQLKVLDYFLAAARDQNKFVNLHTKGGEREILERLDRFGVRRAIVHWYSGPLDTLDELARFGCYFTVGVEVHSSGHIETIAARIPESLLLTETDNPGGLKWLSGSVGMPGAIAGVVEKLAMLRRTTTAAIERLVQANFLRLIGTDAALDPARRLLEAP